jgi:hypothetical protein
MEKKAILDDLVELLEKNSVKIRKDSLGGGSAGLCKLKNGYMFFMDADSNAYENAVSCAKAVKEIVDIETIYLRPEVRDFIEQNGG